VGDDEVVVIMKVISRCETLTNSDIKHALAEKISRYLSAKDMGERGFFIRFDKPETEFHRVGYAIYTEDGVEIIAPTLRKATAIRICDIEDGTIVRWTDESVDESDSLDDIADLLITKRMQVILTFNEDEEELACMERQGISHQTTPSFIPANLGIGA